MNDQPYILSDPGCECNPIYTVPTVLYIYKRGLFRDYCIVKELIKKGEIFSLCRPIGNNGEGIEIRNTDLKF